MQHSYPFPEDRYILVGTVTRPQGLQGEVCVYAHSGQPANLSTYTRLFLVDEKGELSPELRVTGFRTHKGKAILRFDRVNDRTHAEYLTGMGVLVAREKLPEPAENEFYWHQLIGNTVITVDGREVGTLSTVFSNGAQDVMVIIRDDREILVPCVPGIFTGHDEETVIIDPPPGLLDINRGDDGKEDDEVE